MEGRRRSLACGPPFAGDHPMAFASTRTVLCLNCASWFRVPSAAMVLTCPCCYQRVRVEDIIIDSVQYHTKIETCGVLRITRKGALTCNAIKAAAGLIVEGEVSVQQAAAYRVVIGVKASWSGDCQAAAITVEPGASIRGGRFSIVPVASHPPQQAQAEPGEPHRPTAEPMPRIITRQVSVPAPRPLVG